MKYCEFIGDGVHDFDEVGYGKQCRHIGFIPATGQGMCEKYKQPIDANAEGWMVCCSECKVPVQVKES